jgi:hypothetical protein
MSDATCPRCGGDNLTDYPVCDTCATVAHFTHRERCLHCERKHAAAIERLAMAAPEMLEFVQQVANTWLNDCQFIPCDTEAAHALATKMAGLAAQASQLLAKIEGDAKFSSKSKLSPLAMAATDMFEMLAEIRDQHLIPRCGFDDCTDCDDKIFAARIDELLTKIEGGEA